MTGHLDWSYDDDCLRIQSQMPGALRPRPRSRRNDRHHQARQSRRARAAAGRHGRKAMAARARHGDLDRRSVRTGHRRVGHRRLDVTGIPLLDTHAWVWWIEHDPRLPRAAFDALEQLPADSRPYLCDISLWEV